MVQCKVCKNKFYMHGDICDDCLEDETIKETIQKLSANTLSMLTSGLC
jgi:hypothetical protein